MTRTVPTLLPRRVTVVAPRARVDVTLPAQAVVSDVVHELSVLVDEGGAGARHNVDSSGWVMTLLPGQTLDDEVTVAQAGVRDGDVLYLQPRTPPTSAPLLDDVVDAVALASGEHHRWGAASSRAAALLAAAGVVVFSTAVLVVDGAPRWAAGAVAGVGVVILLGTATLLLRALRRPVTSTVALLLALAVSALAGGLPLSDGPLPASFGAAALLLASAALIATSFAAHLLVPGHEPLLVGVVFAAAAFGLLAALTLLLSRPGPGQAAIGATLLVLFAPLLPPVSMRLGRVPMPRVPRDVEEFRNINAAAVGDSAIAAGLQAERFLTALLAGWGTVLAGCVLVVLRQDSRWALLLGAAATAALLLRARHYRSTIPKAASMATVAVSGVLVAAELLGRLSPTVVLAVVVVAFTAAAVVVLLLERKPPRPPSPHRGRWLDVAEILALVVVVPAAAGVLDLYRILRGIGG